MTDEARAARLELERLLEADAPALLPSLPAGFAGAAEGYVRLLLEANARLAGEVNSVQLEVERIGLVPEGDVFGLLPRAKTCDQYD